MDENCYRIEGLSVGYHGTAIIRDIDLRLRKGAIITLIGPNGSGKSTILKTISRQLSAVSGTIYLDGKLLSAYEAADLAKKEALLLTERIHPELMSCRDIVAMGRYPYTGRMGILNDHDNRVIDDSMRAAGIDNIADRDFNAISDGQRQRVLFARALCQEPEVLILDEPTSFLDIRHKLEMMSILRNLVREKGITVILSLHEIDLARIVSDEIICVKGDTIFLHGTPEEIFHAETIQELYGIDNGSYDPLTGCIEPAPAPGEPKILVISSGGSGIPVYRKLQREGIPFAAGILYRNDIDYGIARHMASEVITEEPFREIREETLQAALDLARRVDRVVYADVEYGEINRRIRELVEKAKSLGKLEEA